MSASTGVAMQTPVVASAEITFPQSIPVSSFAMGGEGQTQGVASSAPSDPNRTSAISDPIPCVTHCNLMVAALHNATTKPSLAAFTWLKDDCTIASSFTNAELWHRSSMIGQRLMETHKLKRGDRVMIVYPFGLDFIIAFLACLRVGVVIVSVYPPNPAKLASDIKKFSHFVKDSGATLALTTRKYASMVRYSGLLHKWPKNLQWISTDNYSRRTPAASLTSHDITPGDDELAFVQYTSGSTGNPKGVMITHGNMKHQLSCLASCPRPYGRYVGWVPQYHDMGLFHILMAMYTGMPSWLMSPIQAIEKFKGTWTCGPNFALALTCKRLKEKGLRSDCSSLNACVIGAEPTLPSTLDSAEQTMGIPRHALLSLYGLAESCVFVLGRCHAEGPLVEDGRVCVGSVQWSASLGIDVVVAEECGENEMAQVGGGQIGELCVRSASVAAGYWQKPELTTSTFGATVWGREGTYLRTGDQGYVRGDNVYVTCRLKDLIIVNGRNVWPSDLEIAAEEAFKKQLRPGCSAAFQGSEMGAILVCEVRDGQEAGTLASSVQRVVEAECGVTVEQVVLVAKGQVPKTTSGKVARRAAAEALREGKLKAVGEATARQDASAEEATTLEGVLEACGVEDWEKSVVENGLSSMQVMQVINLAKDNLDIDIDYESLSNLPAAELLQRFSSSSQQSTASPPLLVSALPPARPSPPGRSVRVLLQTLILVGQLCAILVAAIPSVALVDINFDGDSRLWLNRGRAGPWIALAVVMWMLSYTALCIVGKWVLVGRIRPAYLPLWGFKFTCWMMVERLFTVWEYLVGRFLLETPWLVLVYNLLGARVASSATLDTFFRCWDLVSVERGASVTGLLYPRVFDSGGVRMAAIRIGERAAVGPMAVVQGPAEVEAAVEVEAAAVVPPHSVLGPPGSKWHGNLCRQRKEATAECEQGEDGDHCAAKPWWITRAALPFLFLACNLAAFFVSSSVVGEVQPGSRAWTLEAWLLGLSYVLAFFVTGLQLMGFVLLLKWSFVSPFLTDAITALTINTYLPFLERNPVLVGAWHRLLGMRVGSGAIILYSWACPPSKAHLCSVGRNSVIFSTVLAPRSKTSLWSWLRGRSVAPWREGRDIVIEDNTGLYAQGRVERTVRVGAASQLAGFSRIEAGTEVAPGQLLAGNPPIRIEKAGGAEPEGQYQGVGWQRGSLSLLMLAAHRGFVTAVIAVGIHVEKELPGASEFGGGGVGVQCAVLLRVALLTAWIIVGELGEMLLYKWVVLGRAKAGHIGVQSWQAMLVLHGTMMWDQSLPLCSAFLSGGFGMDCVLWLLGFKVDVGMVLCTNLPCVPAQDAELVTLEAGAVIDEFAYVSAHNVTISGVTLAPTKVSGGAVMHPLAGLFASSLGADATMYPRSKSLREMQTGDGETWVGAPAFRAVCQVIPAEGLSAGDDSRSSADAVV